MNIVWLTNLALPELSDLMGQESSPYGGWLINASKLLSQEKGMKLTIVSPDRATSKFKKYEGVNINYYTFPVLKNKNKNEESNHESFREILTEVEPDLVHIYGTEYSHTLSMVKTCEDLGIASVTSIQGLVSIYAQHMYADLPFSVIYGKTLRNFLLGDSVREQKESFLLQGKDEVEAIKTTDYVIGRTTWDKACTSQIDRSSRYFHCNETLREEFYNWEWDIKNIEKYSIFLSQASYSIKGLHYMLDALEIILEQYPETKVYISGENILKSDSLKDKIKLSKYAKYIRKKINNAKLNNNIIFTGPLNEKEMCQRYLNSNVFVCPSSIENSPNSVGEAMILGVPCVASYVGGTPDMLEHNIEGYLYQKDSPYMLAYYISEIFSEEEKTQELSKNARKRALVTHDRLYNKDKLLEIYNEIIQ